MPRGCALFARARLRAGLFPFVNGPKLRISEEGPRICHTGFPRQKKILRAGNVAKFIKVEALRWQNLKTERL